MKQVFTLQKKERLKSRKKIEELFKIGRSFNAFPYRVLWLLDVQPQEKDTVPVLQCGFTASARHFKRAVDRNRIKRLIKEAYRLQKSELEKLLMQKHISFSIFIIYTGKELPDFALAKDKLLVILNKLIQYANEKSTPAA